MYYPRISQQQQQQQQQLHQVRYNQQQQGQPYGSPGAAGGGMYMGQSPNMAHLMPQKSQPMVSLQQQMMLQSRMMPQQMQNPSQMSPSPGMMHLPQPGQPVQQPQQSGMPMAMGQLGSQGQYHTVASQHGQQLPGPQGPVGYPGMPFAGASAATGATAASSAMTHFGKVPLEEVLEVASSAAKVEKDETKLEIAKVVGRDAAYELRYLKDYERDTKRVIRKRAEIEYYLQARQLRKQNPAIIFGSGYLGYGNGWTGNKVKIVYPRNRRRPTRISKEMLMSKLQAEHYADKKEALVPIRIDFEVDKFRLRDTFTWNFYENLIPKQAFCESLLDDFGIPLQYAPALAATMEEQVNAFSPIKYRQGPAPDNSQQEEVRIVVKLDITIGRHNLVDQFEWDLNCQENDPEDFAKTMCSELSLGGEFETAIVHSIREQVQVYYRSLVNAKYDFEACGRVDDEEIRRDLCAPVVDIIRSPTAVKQYSPTLIEIPESELDRQDKDRDRDSRRKRRQGRTGGRRAAVASLSDLKESVRTFRTPVYSSVLPGAVDRTIESISRSTFRADNSDDEDSSGSGPDRLSVVETRPLRRGGRTAAQAASAAISSSSGNTSFRESFRETPPVKEESRITSDIKKSLRVTEHSSDDDAMSEEEDGVTSAASGSFCCCTQATARYFEENQAEILNRRASQKC